MLWRLVKLESLKLGQKYLLEYPCWYNKIHKIMVDRDLSPKLLWKWQCSCTKKCYSVVARSKDKDSHTKQFLLRIEFPNGGCVVEWLQRPTWCRGMNSCRITGTMVIRPPLMFWILPYFKQSRGCIPSTTS